MVFIEGPISLSEHKLQNRHFYIFGDEHIKKHKCNNAIHIADFLENLESLDKPIDIFIEIEYDSPKFQRSEPLPGQYIYDIYHKFKNSLSYNKVYSKYRNIRFHYADIRNYSDQVNDLHIYSIKLYKDIRKRMQNIYKYDTSIEYQNETLKILCEIMNDINSRNLFPLVNDKIMIESKINKQLENIIDTNIHSKIKDFFIDKLNKYIFSWEEFSMYAIDIFENYPITDKIIPLAELIDKLSLYIMTIMDFYLISRSFRYSNNVIIYAGESHAEVYRDLLKFLGFDQINITKNCSQCLDVSVFEPFFQ